MNNSGSNLHVVVDHVELERQNQTTHFSDGFLPQRSWASKILVEFPNDIFSLSILPLKFLHEIGPKLTSNLNKILHRFGGSKKWAKLNRLILNFWKSGIIFCIYFEDLIVFNYFHKSSTVKSKIAKKVSAPQTNARSRKWPGICRFRK